jgi:hypothetical protein
MNLATGEVLTDTQKRHAATDVLRFFIQIDASVRRGLAVHVVLDNLSVHSAPQITAWLHTATGGAGRCTSPPPRAPG